MQFTLSQSAVLPVRPAMQRKPRAEGIHLSEIVHAIAEALDPRRFGDKEGEREHVADLETVPQIWLGQACDHYLKVSGRAIDVGEIQKDGIWLTCDGVDLVEEPPRAGLTNDPQDDWVLEEFKLTWLSSNHPLDGRKFRHWFWQIKGYCWAWETCRARLRVFYVNGNYAPKQPLYHSYELLFTYEELKTNWQMITGHARKRGLIP
jgi:hypothetical protein